MADDMWKDPFPPEDFSPDDATVASIVERAKKAGPRPVYERPRWNIRSVGGLAAMAALVIIAALGSRGMQLIWGEKLLPNDQQYSSGNAEVMEAAPRQGAEVDGAATAAPTAPQYASEDSYAELDGAQADSAAMEMKSTEDTAGRSGETFAASGASGSSGSISGGVMSVDFDALVAMCDAVAYGEIAKGVLTVTETLYGTCDDMIALDIGDSLNATAYVLLSYGDGGWALSRTDAALFVEDMTAPDMMAASAYPVGTIVPCDVQGAAIQTQEPLYAHDLREACERARE